jgi:hypothetical protein
VPGLADRVRDELPNALDVVPVYEREEQRGGGEVPLRTLEPRDQFVAYYRAHHQAEPADPLLEAFDEVHELELERA